MSKLNAIASKQGGLFSRSLRVRFGLWQPCFAPAHIASEYSLNTHMASATSPLTVRLDRRDNPRHQVFARTCRLLDFSLAPPLPRPRRVRPALS